MIIGREKGGKERGREGEKQENVLPPASSTVRSISLGMNLEIKKEEREGKKESEKIKDVER